MELLKLKTQQEINKLLDFGNPHYSIMWVQGGCWLKTLSYQTYKFLEFRTIYYAIPLSLPYISTGDILKIIIGQQSQLRHLQKIILKHCIKIRMELMSKFVRTNKFTNLIFLIV